MSIKEEFKRILHGVVGISKASLGIDPADEQTLAKRIDICSTCPEMIKVKGMPKSKSFKCQNCGCFLYFKVRIKTEKCPLEKW